MSSGHEGSRILNTRDLRGPNRSGRVMLALLALLLLPPALSAAAPESPAEKTRTAAGITVAHGYAAFGDLKYPAGFQHYAWVNPA